MAGVYVPGREREREREDKGLNYGSENRKEVKTEYVL
jgi:hypothetical protein